jgi:hypothetical protein
MVWEFNINTRSECYLSINDTHKLTLPYNDMLALSSEMYFSCIDSPYYQEEQTLMSELWLPLAIYTVTIFLLGGWLL